MQVRFPGCGAVPPNCPDERFANFQGKEGGGNVRERRLAMTQSLNDDRETGRPDPFYLFMREPAASSPSTAARPEPQRDHHSE